MIATIVAATFGAATLAPEVEVAPEIVADFSKICVHQPFRFPTAASVARASGWRDLELAGGYDETPELRGKILVSPRKPSETLFIGMRLGALGADALPNVGCAISFNEKEFSAIIGAATVKLGSPVKRDDVKEYALWKNPQTRRIVVIAKGLISADGMFAIAAVDTIEGSKAK